MIQFAFTHFSWFLLIIPLFLGLMIWDYFARKKMRKFLASDEHHELLFSKISVRKRRIRSAMALSSIVFLILALLGPEIGLRLQKVEREGLDIIIALDVSQSMLVNDVSPTRLERAKFEISRMIDEFSGDRVGLIAFAGAAKLQCPLTLDYSAAHTFLDVMNVGIIEKQGTNLSAAIDEAKRSFTEKGKQSRVLVLISDGEELEADAIESAQKAKSENITIHTLSVGTAVGAPVPVYDETGNLVEFKKDESEQTVTSRVNTAVMIGIARAGGGKHYSLSQTNFQKLYAEIQQAETGSISTHEYTDFENRFQWPLGLAFVLLVGEWLISTRRKDG